MNSKKQTLKGVISTTQKGAGYFDLPDGRDQSIYIEPGSLNTALHGDTVEIETFQKVIRGKKEICGNVIRVLERARTTFVGAIKLDSGRMVIIADDRHFYSPVSVSKVEVPKLKLNTKVQFELLPWHNAAELPQAKIVHVIGDQGKNDVEMHSIILEKGFETTFPKTVEREAERIAKDSKQISADELKHRRDFRDTFVITIDPFDAKDFDDAISLRETTGKNGEALYEVGIHIADVSHFVTPGSELDKEALKRGCSVYLVDRTIPMLPEALSNDVCSLNPHEDKFVFSAVFTMNEKAQVLERWFGKGIINSTHRYTYETAQAVIDGKPENVIEYSSGIQTSESAQAGMNWRPQLLILDKLAKLLQKEKFSKGAIEFESQEIKFKLDAHGKPIGVYEVARIDTHKLVEEYMLLANREVAKFIFDAIKKKGGKLASIYRVHDVPDKDKIANLERFVRALGYNLHTKDGEVTAHDLNRLLDEIEGTQHESLIRTATIRSMQKAVYSTKNIGHFGLAFNFYTHFTSPIRRYPDLLVHRTLAKHLHNEPFADNEMASLDKIAARSTEREIDAADAERSSRKLKQVEYMSERIGKTFTGSISGVTKWGIYIEEDESKSEGLVHIRNLGTDFFDFDEKNYVIIGQKSGKRFTLGDKISFKVIGADVEKRILDYELVADTK